MTATRLGPLAAAAPRSEASPSRPSWSAGAALVLGAMTLSWVAAFAWWWLLPPSKSVELVIPYGAAAFLTAGGNASALPQALPQTLEVRVGDTLLVHNLDAVPHRIGPLWVAPGSRERTSVTSALVRGGALVCSFHPSGALSVTPRSRPGLAVTLPVALAAGLPMSIAALFVTTVVGRLEQQRHASDGVDCVAGDLQRDELQGGPRG